MIVFSDETENVRKHFGVSEDQVKQNLEDIKLWYKKQEHLPQDALSEDWIEKVLMRSKYNVELAKQKIDDYYTIRGFNPQMIDVNQNVCFAQNAYNFIPLGRTKDLKRILFTTRNIGPTNFEMDVLRCGRLLNATVELVNRFDTNTGIILIIDCTDYNYDDFKKTMAGPMYNLLSVVLKGHASRTTKINILNPPAYFGAILQLFKSVMNPKLLQRIELINDIEKLFEQVDRDLLPAEYGGKEKSLTELLVDMDTWLDSCRPLLEKLKTEVSNENLRIGEPYCGGAFNMEGGFKNINLD